MIMIKARTLSTQATVTIIADQRGLRARLGLEERAGQMQHFGQRHLFLRPAQETRQPRREPPEPAHGLGE